MIGLDTNILVAHAIPDHPAHRQVHEQLGRFLSAGRLLALTSGVVAEFLHIVTDPKRFETPLTMPEALQWATFWSQAEEVAVLATDMTAHWQWLDWIGHHQLGRKRLLDTILAATWHAAGVREIFTLNPQDFTIFQAFTIHSLR
jgi:predicted nucleic acid-binding protein